MYYLASQDVIEHLPKLPRSKKIKTGYDFYPYVYVINIDEVLIKSYFALLIYLDIERSDFWVRPIIPSLFDGTISKSNIKKQGLFNAVEKKFNLTKEENIAYCLYNTYTSYNFSNPIDFINSL